MPIDAIEATLSPYVQRLVANVRARPLIAASAIGAAVPLLSYMVHSYRGFLALPPGGAPQNLFGWALQVCAQPFSRSDVTATEPYRDPRLPARYGPHARASFLGAEPLPPRRGDRPTVPGYVFPHRQTTEAGDAALIDDMNAFLRALARANPALLEIRPSGLEGSEHSAVFLAGPREALPAYLVRGTAGEVAHVHSEASSHVVLSLADAEEAMRLGWAQRHKLSGVFHVFPLSYVMIYAPRDDAEMAVWKRLVGAAIDFNAAWSGAKAQLDV